MRQGFRFTSQTNLIEREAGAPPRLLFRAVLRIKSKTAACHGRVMAYALKGCSSQGEPATNRPSSPRLTDLVRY